MKFNSQRDPKIDNTCKSTNQYKHDDTYCRKTESINKVRKG